MQALSAAALQHRLTDEERRTFNESGILYVRDALSPQQVEQGVALTERIHHAKMAEGHDPRKALFYPNFIPDDPFFVDLVDYERILPKIWGILGWNIYFYHAHLIITPPNGRRPTTRPSVGIKTAACQLRDGKSSPPAPLAQGGLFSLRHQ